MENIEAISHLKPKEKKAFLELKNVISSQYEKFAEDNFALYRFLKAREFNVQQAEKMIINHMNFRKKMKLDTKLQDYKPLEVFLKYAAYNILGMDNEGSSVAFIDFGNCDAKGLIKSSKMADRTRCFVHYIENSISKYPHQNTKVGSPNEKIVMIINCENFSFLKATHKATLDHLMMFASIFEANYPERLKIAYFINTLSFFSYFYGLMKMWFPAETFRKIQVFGKDGYAEELLKIMDPKILPVFLGGTRCDSDGNPRCEKEILFCDIVPKRYYLKSNKSHSAHPDAETYELKRRSTIEITQEVSQAGSYLEWEFESQNHNIGFGLYYKSKQDKNMMSLIPLQKTDCHIQSETGAFYCKESGIYIFVLDNSYSWFTSKRIYFRSSVTGSKVDIDVDNNN